jgi:hypothetical protein
MLVRVDPEDLLAAGHRMADDGPTLRALAALAAAADTLARGLADSGRRYGDVEDRLAVMGRAVVG